MGDVAVFADVVFGFHAQQAGEKLFKSWLALLGETYPLTHDLTELLRILATREPDAVRFDGLTDYTPYAVQFRCGPDDAGAGSLDRGRALGQVEELLEVVRRRLMEEEEPDGEGA